MKNDLHELFTMFVKKLLSMKTFPAELNAVCELAQGGLKDWESTTHTVKHIFLAALPLCKPSKTLYTVYSNFAQKLVDEMKDSNIDEAIRVHLVAFMKVVSLIDSIQDDY